MAGLNNTEVILAIRNPCNYKCFYCVGGNKRDEVMPFDLNKLSNMYSTIGEFILTTFECGAGEPSHHPEIANILEMATQYGVVTLPTNGSLDVNKWVYKDRAQRVVLRYTLHPQAEVECSSFINRVRGAMDYGCRVRVGYILHPMRLHNVPYYQDMFDKLKIPFFIDFYKGEYNGKIYPASHLPEEQALISHATDTWVTKLVLDIKHRDWSGIPCITGMTSMYVHPNGRMQRCLYDPTPYTQFGTAPEPCRSNCCGCGMYLSALNQYNNNFWNLWRSIGNFPLMPAAQDIDTYESKKEIYFNLVRSHSKEP